MSDQYACRSIFELLNELRSRVDPYTKTQGQRHQDPWMWIKINNKDTETDCSKITVYSSVTYCVYLFQFVASIWNLQLSLQRFVIIGSLSYDLDHSSPGVRICIIQISVSQWTRILMLPDGSAPKGPPHPYPRHTLSITQPGSSVIKSTIFWSFSIKWPSHQCSFVLRDLQNDINFYVQKM